jgi:hypothetical protein
MDQPGTKAAPGSGSLPPLPELLEEVAANTTHGASELYVRVLDGIAAAESSPPDLPERLLEIARDMAPLIFLSEQLSSSSDWRNLAISLRREREIDINLISEAILGFLPEQADLFCHSRSGTVLAVLERIADSVGKVFQTVSSPGEEGRAAHNHIKRLGIDTWLVNDDAFSDIAVSRAIPLLGADAVTTDFFVNKTGSADIVSAALEAGIPVYVVAAREKLINPEHYVGKPRDSELFERVPITEGVILVTPGMKDEQPKR